MIVLFDDVLAWSHFCGSDCKLRWQLPLENDKDLKVGRAVVFPHAIEKDSYELFTVCCSQ